MDATDPLLANRVRRRANRVLPHLRYRPRAEQGAVAVMFASMLLLIIGFFGLALDLSRIYNRKAELQGVADSVALAAAKKLNGTSGGINDALAAAHAIVELGDDQFKPKYNYKLTMTWSDAAIKFGRSPDGNTGWLDAGAASLSPADVAYVRVDTNELDPAFGSVEMVFMPVLSSSFTTVNVRQVSVAGRARINIIPLAICAMSPTPAVKWPNAVGYEELVEYGFRRGVSYDLMKLNSENGPPANYLVDPISLAGSSSASNFAETNVGPHVCTGTMAVPKVVGASISVQSGFPIGVFFNHLNSRFDQSGGKCDPNAAPPDTNVKQYVASSLAWMSPKPIFQTAETTTAGGKLRTIADLDPPNSQIPTHYGPLWAFARAVPWSSYTPPEPAAGYVPFAATTVNWGKLYSTGPGLGSYPTGATMTPYFASSSSFTQLPSLAHRPGIKYRRVLNVPLLACPVSGSSATVLAVGKFFMTVPATSSTISAEFAGVANDQQVGGAVEFYQ